MFLIFSYTKYKKFMFNLMDIIKVNIITKVAFQIYTFCALNENRIISDILYFMLAVITAEYVHY